MGRNTCFVPRCNTGYRSDRKKCKEEGRKVKSLFAPPTDPDLFELWKRIIPRKDMELTRNCSVCELHFSTEDILRVYEIKMPDDSIYTHPRTIPKLKPGTVPSIFPGLPEYFNKRTLERKLPMDRSAVASKKSKNVEVCNDENKIDIKTEPEDSIEESTEPENSIEESTEPENSIEESTEPENSIEESTAIEFNFNCLLEDQKKIETPSEWWCINCTKDFMAIIKWTPNYLNERKVIIKQDLSIKLFLEETELDILQKVNCINDVSFLLKKVDDLLLCAGIKERHNEKCHLVLPPKKKIQGRHSNLCVECRKFKKQVYTAERRLKLKKERNKYKKNVPASCFC